MKKASEFAAEHHQGQTYGDLPYTAHLEQVWGVVREFRMPTQRALIVDWERFQSLCDAAWLHDVVEDTEATSEMVAEVFGAEVGDLVAAVTDGPGKNRKERKAGTYIRIRTLGEEAVALKLADRIANVRSSLKQRPSLLKMYQKEQKGFKEALYQSGECEVMWSHLEEVLG